MGDWALLFRLCKNNISDTKDSGIIDVCNPCSIRRKIKLCCFFLLVLNSGQIIRNQGKEGRIKKKLEQGMRLVFAKLLFKSTQMPTESLKSFKCIDM